MRKISKFFIILGLSATLLTVPSTFSKETGNEVYAQGILTLDIQNLLSGIIDMLQQAEGIAADMGEITKRVESMKQVIEFIQTVTQGAKIGLRVVKVFQYADREYNLLKECSNYFINNGCTAAVIYASAGLASECISLYTDVKKVYDDAKADYMNLVSKGGDNNTIGVMKIIDEAIEKTEQLVFTLCYHYERRMGMIYRFQQSLERIKEDKLFKKLNIF
jgi:hypothetical protein